MRLPLVPRGKGGGFRLALNYLSFAFFASILAPFFCRGKFDLIFIYEPSPITVGLPALVLKKLKSAPIMFWMQDLWPESLSATGAVRSEKILKMVDMLVRSIYKGCDRILVQSQAFFEPVKRQGGDSSRILYFPNSAEELYQPVILEEDAPERAVMPEGFCVTFAGNIGAAQDFGTILNAAELLKDHTEINWVIIGDGRMFPWVKSQVVERNLMQTVHLLGRYPVEAMPNFFTLSDVLLVTLKKEPIFALTIPSKVQSYLACAKPIIAALDGEGARIIKEADAGLTCPAENPEALAKAVLTLYNMPQSERQVMGTHGRTYFNSHFEHKMLLDRLEIWMEELIKDK
ncbi:MAG: glycosyltransferase family 4 protein [Desulfobacterales bacterium]|nr:glycosyltransferase family 4 protein [Desulfobacterales bacterium]